MNNVLHRRGSATGETIGSAISRARNALFTGRRQELQAFGRLLEAGHFPRFVLVHGPGGIGKSSLLDGFARISETHGLPFERIDARLLPATPDTLRQAVTVALPADEASTPTVIAIDHAEQITALDRWLRLELLPELPLNTVLILAGRNRPDPAWYADPGLQPYIEELELRPFDDEEAAEYLRHRELNPAVRDKVRHFARGHPLALALTADHLQRRGAETFDAAEAPDLIQTLVDWMLRDIDDPLKLTALQACATVRRMDDALLAVMLDTDDTDELFNWLAEQPVIERQRDGLVIHDLVRELVVQDLRGRDLKRHHQLIRRANKEFLTALENNIHSAVHHWLGEIMYVLRHEPYMQHNFPFDDYNYYNYYPDRAHPDEWPGIAGEVESLIGSQARNWFEYWLQIAPQGLTVIRDKNQSPAALSLVLVFRPEDIACEHDDPAIHALFRYLHENVSLRPGEDVLLMRFAQAYGTAQDQSPVRAHIGLLAGSLIFTPCRFVIYEADLAAGWSGEEEIDDLRFFPGTEYTLGRRRYMLSGHDSRRETPVEWIRNTSERILCRGADRDLRPPDTVTLDRTDFETAAKQALRHFHDDKALDANPLLNASLMHRRHTDQPTPAALRQLLKQTSAINLGGDDTRSYHTVLANAYFNDRQKRIAAAGKLHVSERTFRRRLREAEARLIAQLWRLETKT